MLIPVRGDAPFLFQALKSLCESTLIPSEVLIIDDRISENTIDELNNSKFNFDLKLVKNKGKGLVDALNTGLNFASYELIARLDSDDMVYRSRFEQQSNLLNSSPEVAVVGSQVTYIDSNNKILGNSSYPLGNIVNSERFNHACLMAHPSVMYRKSSLQAVGGYREVARIGSTSLCEDFDLWKRVAKVGEMINLEQQLTFYRQHSGQLSNQFRYAQELATIYVEAEGFERTRIKFEIVRTGHISSYNQIRKSINNLSIKQKMRFYIYSRLIRNDLKFKKLQICLLVIVIKFLNSIHK